MTTATALAQEDFQFWRIHFKLNELFRRDPAEDGILELTVAIHAHNGNEAIERAYDWLAKKGLKGFAYHSGQRIDHGP
jgi:hypothetical protein